MKLTPVTAKPQQSYPARVERRTGGRTWLKRAIAAASTAGALCFGGCYGSSPIGEIGPGVTPPDTTEPATIVSTERPGRYEPAEERLSGDWAPMWFQCGDAAPEYLENIGAPGWFEGSLCGDQTSWAAFDVEGDGPDLRINLDYGGELAVIAVIAPDGTEVAELGADTLSAVVSRTPGRFLLAATALDPTEHGWDWFSGTIELVEE